MPLYVHLFLRNYQWLDIFTCTINIYGRKLQIHTALYLVTTRKVIGENQG